VKKKHIIIQQMHKYIICRYNENYYKTFKIAPTCFGSQGIHHQGALYSAWLKASLDCAVHIHTTGKYAAVTPTTSISTHMIEPLL